MRNLIQLKATTFVKVGEHILIPHSSHIIVAKRVAKVEINDAWVEITDSDGINHMVEGDVTMAIVF